MSGLSPQWAPKQTSANGIGARTITVTLFHNDQERFRPALMFAISKLAVSFSAPGLSLVRLGVICAPSTPIANRSLQAQ
jgi:hypothetical protein